MNELIDVIKDIATDVCNANTPDIATLGIVLETNPLSIKVWKENNIILKEPMLIRSYFISPEDTNPENSYISTLSTATTYTGVGGIGSNVHAHNMTFAKTNAFYNTSLIKDMIVLLIKIDNGEHYVIICPVFPQ